MGKGIFINFEASAMNGFPVQVAYGMSEADLKCFLMKPLDIWNDADYMWDFNADKFWLWEFLNENRTYK
jgi:hypothetical protein